MNPAAETSQPRRGATLACAALAVLGFAVCSYGFAPGIMDGDAFGIFNRRVLGERITDWHPPIFAWMWSIIHRIIPGPLGLLLVIQAAYWGGLGLLGAGLVRRNYVFAGVLVVLAGAYPLALHLTSALLKDTFVAVFFLLSVGLAVFASSVPGRWRSVLFALAVVALFLGIAFRYNAAAGAIPLAASIAVLAGLHRRLSWAAAVTGVFAATVLFGAVQIVNRYAIKAEPSFVIGSLYIFDLGGISYRTGRDTFDGLLGPGFVERNRTECYTPVAWAVYAWGHCKDVGPRVRREQERIGQLWRTAILAEPKAYLLHRRSHFGAVVHWKCPDCPQIGMWRGWANNPPEYRFVASPLYDVVERSADPLYRTVGKPYIALTLLFLAFAIGWLRRSTLPGQLSVAVAGSGILYALSYFFVGVDSPWRYMYWTVLAAIICVPLILAIALPRPRSAGASPDKAP